MRYILAVLLPPVAVLLCGKPFQALFNILFTLVFWLPGVIHALLVVNDYHAEQQADRIERALGVR